MNTLSTIGLLRFITTKSKLTLCSILNHADEPQPTVIAGDRTQLNSDMSQLGETQIEAITVYGLQEQPRVPKRSSTGI
jgi:hypothetical protein